LRRHGLGSVRLDVGNANQVDVRHDGQDARVVLSERADADDSNA
jgi:hypothetical protein